jgi:hydrogenase expression/formation protein HypC
MVNRHECLTCGDVAVEGIVVGVSGDTALVDTAAGREQVGVELVAPVAAGDVLLCHAGIAIRKADE